MRLTVVAEYCFGADSQLTDEDVKGQCNAIMSELLALDALDPSVGGSLAKREIEVEVYVEAASLDDAFTAGASQIRSALHFAGVDTSGWPCGQPTYWLGLGKNPDKNLLPA